MIDSKHLAGLIEEYNRFLFDRTNSFWGSLTDSDESAVAEIVRRSSRYTGPIVELGTMFGHTTLLMATHKEKHRKLITVDNYSWNAFCLPPDDHRKFTRRTLRHAVRCANVDVFDGTSAQFFESLDETPSLVFIDAGHKYFDIATDIDFAIASGCSLIAGHDYCDQHSGVVHAVNERFATIEVIGNVWIGQS